MTTTKNLLRFFTFALLAAALLQGALLMAPANSDAGEVSGTGAKIQVAVKGMVCAFCAQGITKKFKNEPAVKSVDVNLEKERVTLTLEPGQDIADEKVKEILTDAGFSVDRIER